MTPLIKAIQLENIQGVNTIYRHCMQTIFMYMCEITYSAHQQDARYMFITWFDL